MNTTVKTLINTCKNVLVVVILVGVVNILPKQIKSLGQQAQEEAKREGIQKVDLREIESSKASDLYTQTQAHVRIKKIRELIQANFKDQVVPYFDIISRMVTKEAELKDTHYVFYHTAPTMLAVMTDLFTQLYFNENLQARATADDTFRFLRFQGQSTDLSVSEFIEKEFRAHGLIDDKNKELMAILLSVNLSLFGNVGFKTESTWARFLGNWRSVENWQQEEFKTILKKFGLTDKYLKEIMALDDIFAVTPESMLLQIFIPKKQVDELVYLAWVRGIPANDAIMQWIKDYQASEATPENIRGSVENTRKSQLKLAGIFKQEQEKNPIFKQFMEELKGGNFSTYAYLKAYCNKPAETPYLNDTQGRILFTKEGLLNPSSGIKFYSYFSTPRNKLEEYTNKLDAIVEKLLAEKRGEKVEAPQLKPTVKPTPSSVKPQPSPVVAPKRTPTPVKTPKQTPITRPTRQNKHQ